MLDTHVYLVMAEQFPLFRLIPDRWLMGLVSLVRALERTPHPPGRALYAGDCREWCVANGLVKSGGR